MGQVLIFIIVLIFIAVGVYFAHLAQKRRREEMAALAAELGWQFYPSRDSSFDDRFSQFSEFRKGHSRYAYNTLRGAVSIDEREWRALMGDYHYKITSGSGKNRSTRTYRFSYLILELPFDRVPELAIRREGIFDKLAGFVGFDDIDFESAEFSDRFHVHSSDKKFAYDIIHPRMMAFLLDTNPPTVDLERGCCCLFDGQRCWPPAEFRSMLSWGEQFFARWPHHVTATLEG